MARLTELFKELTEHVYGHHETETNLVKRLEELEGRVAKLEKLTTSSHTPLKSVEKGAETEGLEIVGSSNSQRP